MLHGPGGGDEDLGPGLSAGIPGHDGSLGIQEGHMAPGRYGVDDLCSLAGGLYLGDGMDGGEVCRRGLLPCRAAS